jgi:hypothetical protein
MSHRVSADALDLGPQHLDTIVPQLMHHRIDELGDQQVVDRLLRHVAQVR